MSSLMNPIDKVEAMEAESKEIVDEKAVPESEANATNGKDSFNCNVCGRSFPFLSSLSQHMRRHTGARPYKCPYCNHRASQKGNLKVHIRSHNLGTLSTHHSNEDDGAEEEEMSVSEGLDGGTSPTKSSSACNKMVNGNGVEESRRKLPVRSLKREKSASDSRPFCCRLCGFEAQREDQLLSHIEKVHITADADEESIVKEEALSEPDASQSQDDGNFPCETCGQVFTQAWFLKSHMKKHAGVFDHCCRICGRRFREAWFLKSHMKTHNTKSRSRSRADSAEQPATINDVAQDPEVVAPVESVYQMCSKCGNLFHNKESLRAHDKVHSFSYARKPHNQCKPCEDDDSPAAKKFFLDYLSLKPVEEKAENEEEGSEELLGQRIPELDPVCSYQAWQLATKGKVVEPVESNYKMSNVGGSNAEEALTSAAVVFEKESRRFVLQGQEKRGPGRRSSSGLGSHTSSGERTPESLSDSEYRPRQDRKRASQSPAPSKINECSECGKVFRSRHQLIVHQKIHSKDRAGRAAGGKDNTPKQERSGSNSDAESGSPSRPSTPGYGDSPLSSALGQEASEMGSANAGEVRDVKPYVCSLCDFVTTESAAYKTHIRVQHPSSHDNSPSPSSGSDRGTPSGFPKLKKALLHGLNNSVSSPSALSPNPSLLDPSLTPVDLCVRSEGHRGKSTMALDRKNLPSHKCSFCSHSTRYPEVLWMHQTVAHRINSNSSSLAPKWAPRNTPKSSKENSLSWRRRTGPPPVLEGKECPPLAPLSRSKRTQPPNHSNEAAKKSRPSSHSSTPTSSSAFLKKSLSSQSSSRPPVRLHGGTTSTIRSTADQNHKAYFKPKVDIYPRTSSSSSMEKSTNSLLRSSHPGSSSAQAPRTNERYAGPQEGLGFMLSSKHALADYNRARGAHHQPVLPSPHNQSRVNSTRPSTITHGSTHGSTHGYLSAQAHGGAPQNHSAPAALASEGRKEVEKKPVSEAGAEMPADVLSFLKNYSPHELAALYHRWGAANALLDPTGMLRSLMRQGQYFCHECGKSFSQPSHLRTHMRSHTVGFDFNGLHRGTDATHATASEAPKQARGHSAASSAHTEPLRKGT